jgi:molybdopterin-containing oxidoreductase family molybdopterin binding subunit
MSLDNESKEQLVFIAPYPLTKQSILKILAEMQIEPQIVETFEGITKIKKETQLILIDLFSFDQNYRDLFSKLRGTAPQAVLLTLLDDHSNSLHSSVLLAGADVVINVNRADIELPTAIQRAVFLNHSLANAEGLSYEREVQSMEQNHESILKREFTRRRFLKGSAATVAVAGASVALPGGVMNTLRHNVASAAANAKEHTLPTICHWGGCYGCPLDVLVRNDNVVRTKAGKIPGEVDLDGICPRGASWAHQIVSPKRIKYPMKRVGERGEGKWEQITWDEAISTICSKIKEYQDKYGKNSVAAMIQGNMTTTRVWSHTRLLNVAEMCEVSMATDQNLSAGVFNDVSAFFFYGGTQSWDYENFSKYKTFVTWGSNMIETYPQMWKLFADAVEKNGAKLVSIDPNYNTTTSKANYHVRVRPGTDAALAMAMIKYLDEKKLTADSYLQARTVAPFLVQENGKFLRKSDLLGTPSGAASGAFTANGVTGAISGSASGMGTDDYVVWDRQTNAFGYASEIKDPEIRKGTFEINGHKVMTAYDKLLERVAPFTLKKAAEICDVPEATIKEIAELLATNGPAEIMAGFAVDHYANGDGAFAAIDALRMVTGMIAWPKVSYNLNTSGFAVDETNHPVSSGTIAPFMFKDLLENGKFEFPGKTVEQQLKAWLILGGNPVAQQPDHKYMVECMKKLDFVAAANIEWCETTQYADIVLPVCMVPEKNDIYYERRTLMYAEQTITPRFESKSDFEISKLIAHGLGFGEWFNFDINHVMSAVLEPVTQMTGITMDRLKKEQRIRPATPEMQMLFTPTGRLQFYHENFIFLQAFGQTPDMKKLCLPYFEPPHEAWPVTAGGYEKNPLAEKYPLVYYTGARRYRVHTYQGVAPVLRELEGTEPLVRMNPKDAAKRGIKEGDHVRIFNDRGHVVAKAVFSTGIRRGMVDMDRGWHDYQTISGHYNDLTSQARNLSSAATNAFYDALCEVEKA